MSTLVAVYGSLKEGYGNHRLLLSSDKMGEDWVEGWQMYSLGGFPAIVKGNSKVKVEIYSVDEETFSRLDRLEGYPSFYDREQVKTVQGDAWIYFHHYKPNAPVVEDGDW